MMFCLWRCFIVITSKQSRNKLSFRTRHFVLFASFELQLATVCEKEQKRFMYQISILCDTSPASFVQCTRLALELAHMQYDPVFYRTAFVYVTNLLPASYFY